MEKTAFIISIISLIISFISWKQKTKDVIVDKPISRQGAVFFNKKTPEQTRIAKKLKQEKELSIDELC